MAIKTAAELKAYFETGDVPTQQQFVDLIDTIFSMATSGLPLIYAAVLLQSSTDNPVPTESKNDLSGTLTFERQQTGNYTLTSSLPEFIEGKTQVFITGDNTGFFQAYWIDASTIGIDTQNSAGATSDDKMVFTSFKIEVYP